MRVRILHWSGWIAALSIAVGCATPLAAVQVGQSRADVVNELGPPAGKMEAAGTEILRYPELTVRLKNGRVVAVDPYVPPAPAPAPASEPVSLPEPAARPIPSPSPAPPLTVPQYSSQKVELHLPKRFVGMPSFETSKGWMTAGTAFLVRRRNDSQAYLLTAHHLFSPRGGLQGTSTHAELPNTIRGFQLVELFGEAKSRPVQACLVPDGDEAKDPIADLALFKVADVADEDAALLADTLPSPGDDVWIIARVQGGVPAGTLVHKARVVLHPSKWLVCLFDSASIVPNGATGAPVINADSRVVGVVSGFGEANGRKFAFIIPSPLIQKTIREL